MDQHPYFNVIAGCIIALTILCAVDLVIAAAWLTAKYRGAADDLRVKRAAEVEHQLLKADAAKFLALPADQGPVE